MVIEIALGICLAVVLLMLASWLLGGLVSLFVEVGEWWEEHGARVRHTFDTAMTMFAVLVVVAWPIALSGVDQPSGWATLLAFFGSFAVFFWLLGTNWAPVRRLWKRWKS